MKHLNENPIKCLLISPDQHSFSIQTEFLEADENFSTTCKPGSDLAKLLNKGHEEGVRMIILPMDFYRREEQEILREYLPSSVEIHPIRQNKDPERSIFNFCETLKIDPSETLVISASRKLRKEAAKEGYFTAAHPMLGEFLLRGEQYKFYEIRGSVKEISELDGFIPYYHEVYDQNKSLVLGILSDSGFSKAVQYDLEILRVPIDPATEDLIFCKVDHLDEESRNLIKGNKVVSWYKNKALIALDGDAPNDSLDIHGEHGHFWFLMPDPGLLKEPPISPSDQEYTFTNQEATLLQAIDKKIFLEEAGIFPGLKIFPELIFPKCPVSATTFQSMVDKYSGTAAIDSLGAIVSREVRHSDNPRVVNALVKDLQDMGYCAWTHSFSFGNQVCKNVIAELPGRGVLQIKPEIYDKLKKVLYPIPGPEPPKPWLKALEEIMGNEWTSSIQKRAKYPWDIRRLAEIELGLYPYPKFCHLANLGAKLVVVGCHLDSTAASDGGFDPTIDPAPGADDNASGIAGTLAVAKYLTQFRNKLTHTVRFCFFNAEEVGIIGSQAYASFLKSHNVNVKAVVCMDMIGYNSDSNRIFEVHAGYTNPAVRDISVPIANQICLSASQLGKLAPAQIYKGTNSSSGADRNIYDGAIGRSDHASFHQQGYPAVVVSEDFFLNTPAEPSADANPHYHRASDSVIDSAYGADISCAVAHAVKELAK